MRVLLTGITGFVGQHLVPMIVKFCPNTEVMTVNIDLDNAVRLFPFPQCRHVSSSDWDSIIRFDPEVVMHLATVTTEKNDTAVIRPMLSANIEFGVLLLDVLRQCPACRLFVNTGSFAEYRLGPGKINDAYLYAATKTAFRSFCEYYSQLSGFKYITAIPYTIYGGKPTAKRLMDYMIESMTSKIPVDMTAGEQVLDFTHVYDVAGFYVYVLNHLEEFFQVKDGTEFHLGTGIGTSIKEVAQLMSVAFGRNCNINWGGRPYRERDIMHAVAPVDHNALHTDWHTMITLEEGIRMMKDSFVL